MGALKICVYAIAKNEGKFVERFCESALQADLIVIADTGSTDNTVALAKKAGATVFNICVTPWRFDKARDAALALVPGDFDVCIALDLDEVLEPGWREEIERVWTPGTTRLKYGYDWGRGHFFLAEKIHARKGYFWHHPCHEYPRLDPRCTQIMTETTKLLIRHLPDAEKSRGTYLELLEMSVKEDQHCSRNSFYYARELHFYGRVDDCIAECKRYLALPDAVWNHERCYASRLIGKCLEIKGQLKDAESWYYKAAMEAPETREPWCALASLFYTQGRWADCYAAALRALQITHKELVYTIDPVAWGFQPFDLAAISAWNLGLKMEALRYAKEALACDPQDPRLANNVKLMENVNPTMSGEFFWAS
jgi:glycosyltransferase involved in cell wall biosynthesis